MRQVRQGVALGLIGAYFVDNDGPGLMAPSGITSVRSSGFENR